MGGSCGGSVAGTGCWWRWSLWPARSVSSSRMCPTSRISVSQHSIYSNTWWVSSLFMVIYKRAVKGRVLFKTDLKYLILNMVVSWVPTRPGKPGKMEFTWKYEFLKNLINIMEKWYQTWKNWVGTKNTPLTPRFGEPSLQFKIIFQKKILASLYLA